LPESEVTLLKPGLSRVPLWPEGVESNALWVATEDPEPLSSNAKLFQRKGQPILSARCGNCHNDERKYSGLTLETRSAFSVAVGTARSSSLGSQNRAGFTGGVARLEKAYMRLALESRLPDVEVALIKEWIEGGGRGGHGSQSEEPNARGKPDCKICRNSRIAR
jgi:hypothetical protein